MMDELEQIALIVGRTLPRCNRRQNAHGFPPLRQKKAQGWGTHFCNQIKAGSPGKQRGKGWLKGLCLLAKGGPEWFEGRVQKGGLRRLGKSPFLTFKGTVQEGLHRFTVRIEAESLYRTTRKSVKTGLFRPFSSILRSFIRVLSAYRVAPPAVGPTAFGSAQVGFRQSDAVYHV
jgi:hypothetical protein